MMRGEDMDIPCAGGVSLRRYGTPAQPAMAKMRSANAEEEQPGGRPPYGAAR